MSKNIPHSLGGFRGAFESEHGRRPTEQEIWNAAIRSWRDLNQPESNTATDWLAGHAQGLIDGMQIAKPSGMTDVESMDKSAFEIAKTRYTPVRTSYIWRVKIGDGQQTVGRCLTETDAQRLAEDLKRAFLEGAFVAARSQPVREPLSEDWIRERCSQSWVFETAKQWIRMAESAHGITK